MKKLVFLLVILMLKPFGTGAQDQKAKTRFYEGVVAEEVTGELDKALTIYQELLKNSAGDRQLAAKCLYHIGLTYEKKGSDKALGYYADLLEKYPDQADLADLARGRIAKLKDANTFIDPRDGHKYKWVKIGNQVWMAENLAYMPWVNPLHKQENGIWVYDYDGSDVAVAKASENYQKYGCLYDWPTAMGLDPAYLEKPYDGDTLNHQGICPPGWHMPTDGEWKTLEMFLGMPDSAANDGGFNRAGTFVSLNLLYEYPPVGKFLRSSSGWISNGNGDNSSNFNALPAGARYPAQYKNNPEFSSIGDFTTFWTASEYSEKNRKGEIFYGVWNRNMSKIKRDDIYRYNWDDKSYGESVRCLKNYNNEYPLVNYRIRKVSEFIKPLATVSDVKSYPQPEVVWSVNTSQPASYTGIYNDQVLVKSDSSFFALDLKTGEHLWKHSIEKKSTEFVIDGNRIFYISGSILYCKDLNTWEVIWQYAAKESGITINLYQNKVIFQSGAPFSHPPTATAKTLYCFNIEDGNLLWEKMVTENFGTHLVVANGLIMFGTSNSGLNEKKNYLIAMDLQSGDEKWKFAVGDAILSDPAIEKDMVVFGCTDKYVYALDCNTGLKIWRYYAGYRMYADPTISNNTVFIGDLGEMFDNNGTACNYHAIDLITGKQKWMASRVSLLIPDGMFNEWSVMLDNVVVTRATRGTLFAFDTSTGGIVWKFHPDNSGIIPTRIKPIAANGIIVTCNKEGIYALRSPKK